MNLIQFPSSYNAAFGNTVLANVGAQRLKRRMRTSGRSTSTLNNYARHLAKMALHFNCIPTELDDDQIEDYLYLLQQQHDTPSESYFKLTQTTQEVIRL